MMWRTLLAMTLIGSVIILLAWPGQTTSRMIRGRGGPGSTGGITSFTFANWFQDSGIHGDTFFSAWGDDDVLYFQINDTPSGVGGAGGANVSFFSCTGYTSSRTCGSINIMAPWGGFTAGGSDGASYKSSSVISVQGTMYISVNRQFSGTNPTWFSSQFIKSTNHGVTWTPVPPGTAQPYASPMFTDSRFRLPMWFQYGKDYVGQTVDRSNEFVYALSVDLTSGHYQPTTGTYSDRVFLGRATIANMPALNGADWQYYQGGDGLLDANWGGISTAVPVISTPGTYTILTEGTALYLPTFGQYLLINNFQTVPAVYTSLSWEMYVANHPWGPWSKVQTFVWDAATSPPGLGGNTAFYFPGLVAKSVTGNKVSLFTNGNFNVSADYVMVGTEVTVH
jgi:hypothetical protein